MGRPGGPGSYASGGQAFIDNAGVFTAFSDPSATGSTEAYGINTARVIVGTYFDGAAQYGFVDNGGHFVTLDDPSATGGTAAIGINDAGIVVGYYQGPAGYEGFIATPTPEPAAWALMVIGFGGLGAVMRTLRRKRAFAAA